MFWVFLIIAVLLTIGFVIYKIYENFVNEHSLALKKLREINYKYNFHLIEEIKLEKHYDNESYYNLISPKDYLVYNLQFIEKKVRKNIELTAKNRMLNNSYRSEIEQITLRGSFNVAPIKPLKLLLYIENKLFIKYTKKPTINFIIKVSIYLTNINGKILTSKKESFFESDINNLIIKINDKDGDRFKDRKTWDSISSVERGKVSNRLRFLVYKRDNYRCRICGRKTKDLEVDHIFPISKGGKTTLDNLQTLCRSCNSKKSNTIEKETLNNNEKQKYVCPKCGAPLKIKVGKYGRFYGCMNYPKCNYTEKIKK